MIARAKNLSAFCCALATVLDARAAPAGTNSGEAFASAPLEMRVPFEPTAFPSLDRKYLTYELYLTNFKSSAITVRRVEVLDADKVTAEPIASFEAGSLNTKLHRIGDEFLGGRIPAATDNSRTELASGATVLIYLWIDRAAGLPSNLRHRVITADSTVEGATIAAHRTKLRVYGPPLKGPSWLASSAPSNDSHHRRDVLVYDGHSVLPHRYAIDWVQTDKGVTYSGDARENRSYLSYDEPVLAVGDGTVIAIKNGIPDNAPHRPPVTKLSTNEDHAGNFVVLDLGDGQFAHYAHLQPGSLRVKPGDRVRRGRQLASVGSSGDAREPHLHFEITTSSTLLAGEGIPYLVDQFRIRSKDGSSQLRKRELPLADMTIDFDPTLRGRN